MIIGSKKVIFSLLCSLSDALWECSVFFLPPFLGSRLKTSLDFGHVQLNIAGVRPSDSGIYTCKATNALGTAVSTTSIKVEGRTTSKLKVICSSQRTELTLKAILDIGFVFV